MPAAGDEWAVVERGGESVRFRPARPGESDVIADLRDGRWRVEGELGVLAARVEGGRLRSEEYPDPLARVFAALAAPHSGDFVVSLEPGFEAVDWGGTSHAGGGSHGALGAGDSLGPLLFVGCGPELGRGAGAVDPARRRPGRPRPLRDRLMPRWLLALALLLALAIPASASAAEPDEPVSSAEAVELADRDPTVVDQREKNGTLSSSVKMNDERWEVAYFNGDDQQVALAIVDPESGEVEEAWTGYQVAWKMARGYSGAFGHKLNAPYVFVPLCLIFLIGLVDWRRWRRVANLDLLVLLGFGVSHFFFNRAEIGVSVPLYYPALVYLLARALWIGFRGWGEGLRPVWPTVYLLVAALALMGFRTGLNMADAGVADIGYASVVGADRITHGEPIYGNFPDDVSQGDTYGPATYYSYVPFELVFPWSGTWDDLPAGHAAAFTFDLLVFGLLILLGRRIRPGPEGNRLAAILAFGWAAYPYTAYALESNTNDPLVALFLVGLLLVLSRPLARGALAAAATLAKFAPAVLAPLLLTYEAKRRSTPALCGRFRPGRSAGPALAGARPRLQDLLRAHLRVPGRPRLAVQHLGPGRVAGAVAHGADRADRGARRLPRLPPAREVAGPGCGPERRPDHRDQHHDEALVLPLHRLVLPAAAGRPGGAPG